MSILIKDMEIPQNCEECGVKVVCKKYWKLIREQHTRPSWCPLVILQPHGRLIDADALYKTIDATSERTIGHTTFKETVLLDIRGMPTILESTMGQVNSEKAINEAEEGEK